MRLANLSRLTLLLMFALAFPFMVGAGGAGGKAVGAAGAEGLEGNVDAEGWRKRAR